MKKILLLTMLMSILFVLLFACGSLAEETQLSLDENENYNWEFTHAGWDGSHGLLVISGYGGIPDNDSPWAEYAEEIDQIVIGAGINRIGSNVFSRVCF